MAVVCRKAEITQTSVQTYDMAKILLRVICSKRLRHVLFSPVVR